MKQLYPFLFFGLSLVSLNCIAQKQGIAKTDSLSNVINMLNKKEASDKNKIEKINTLNEWAYEMYRKNPDSTILLAESALMIGQDISYDKGMAYSYYLIGLGNGYLNNHDKAVSFYFKGLSVAKKCNEEKIIAQTYNSLGNVYRFKGDLKTAGAFHFLSIQLYEKLKDETGIAKACINMGVNYDKAGDYVKALLYYKRGLSLSEKNNDSSRMTNCFSSIGTLYAHRGEYSNALNYYFKALKISEALGDRKGMANYSQNIGSVNDQTGNYKNALQYYTRSLEMETQLKNKSGIAASFLSIGHVYDLMQNKEAAGENYSKALAIYKDINDPDGLATTYNHMGDIYLETGSVDTAISFYRQGLDLRQKLGDKQGMAESYHNLALSLLKLKQPGEAMKMIYNSLALAKETGAKPDLRDAYLLFSKCDSSLNNWKGAYDNLKNCMIIKDTIFNSENSKQLAEIQTRYETENKEKEITLLQKDKEIQHLEIKRNETVLRFIYAGSAVIILSSLFSFLFYKRKRDAEQKQKETLLSLQVSETEMKALRSQMNPHFIFNALQSIQTFLISNKSEDANLYLLKFSKLMRAVLENSQHSEVPLKDDMQALELYMQLESIRLAHPFTYQFHMDASVDTERDCLPPLILQPFVENAIWHGLQYKESSGHIDIFISKKNNALFATVEDNGVGRDMSKQVTQPMLLKKESLGMKLTEERLKILNETKNANAHFKITDLFTKDKQPAGTRVELSLPLVA